MVQILPDLISNCQFAFIRERYISKNSFLAHELVCNFSKKGADKFCSKVDLHKAYDKINRKFILHMLACMGFPGQLIKLITKFILTPTYSIMINGFPKGYISSNRGLRKGDSLSPPIYLLLL